MPAKIHAPAKEEFVELYNKMTFRALCEHYFVSENVMRRWKKEFGLKKEITGRPKKYNIDIEELKELRKTMTNEQIAKKYGCTRTRIDQLIKKHKLSKKKSGR